MTINEMWIQMHDKCIGSSVSENGEDVKFHCPVHNITLNEKAPYPFCRTPRKCAGVGTCRREYACND